MNYIPIHAYLIRKALFDLSVQCRRIHIVHHKNIMLTKIKTDSIDNIFVNKSNVKKNPFFCSNALNNNSLKEYCWFARNYYLILRIFFYIHACPIQKNIICLCMVLNTRYYKTKNVCQTCTSTDGIKLL